MAGWDYYVLEKQDDTDRQAFLSRLSKLGSESWELVAVDSGTMYFKRYAAYEDGLRVGVAAENEADGPLFDWVANSGAGEKSISSATSMNAAPDGVEHSHRVMVIVDQAMHVVRGGTDEVDGHVHSISILGMVDEVDGHTHTFAVEAGGVGTTRY